MDDNTTVIENLNVLNIGDEDKQEISSEINKDDNESDEDEYTDYIYNAVNDFSSNLSLSLECNSLNNLKSDSFKSKVIYPTENEKCMIRKTRLDFEVLTIAKKGPFFIPTLFVNHVNRKVFINRRDGRCFKRLPKNSVDSYDLFCAVNQGICESVMKILFLKHSKICELVYLKKEFSPELAFEEILMSRPFFYSTNIEERKKSKYIDPDQTHWVRLDGCDQQHGSFIVEFCVIFPEDKISTAIVSCAKCGRFIEMVFDVYTWVVVKRELMKFSMSLDIKSDEQVRFRDVLPLQDDMVLKPQEPTFAEGIVGFTPLTGTPFNPSVFIRVRIKYSTNSRCVVRKAIHESQGEEELFPDYLESTLP